MRKIEQYGKQQKHHLCSPLRRQPHLFGSRYLKKFTAAHPVPKTTTCSLQWPQEDNLLVDGVVTKTDADDSLESATLGEGASATAEAKKRVCC